MNHAIAPFRSLSDKTLRILSYALYTVAIIAFCMLYGAVIFDIVSLWFTRPHTYAQGALIFLITIYMVVHKKSDLVHQPFESSLIWGSLLTIMGGLLFVAGELSETVSLQQLSLIVTLLGSILLIFGYGFLRILFLPVCYLIFLFPVFDAFLGGKIVVLQKVSAAIAELLLRSAGFSVFRHGHILQLPHITLDVVAACSGLNHIISLVAIAIPLSYFSQLSRIGKIFLVMISVMIGILANGLRVALIGIWTSLNPDANVHGPGDLFLISFVFIFGLCTLLAVNHLFLRFGKQKFNTAKKIATRSVTISDKGTETSKIAALTLTVGIILIFYSASLFVRPHPVNIPSNTDLLPKTVGTWSAQAELLTFDELAAIQCDQNWFMRYRSLSGQTVYGFIAYFSEQKKGHELFSTPINRILHSASVQTIPALQNPPNKMLIFQNLMGQTTMRGGALYLIDNKYYVLRSEAKLASLLNIVKNRRNNGALILFLHPNTTSDSHTKNDSLAELAAALLPHIKATFRNAYTEYVEKSYP